MSPRARQWLFWICWWLGIALMNLFWFLGFRYAARRFDDERAHKELFQRALIRGVVEKCGCGTDGTIVIRIDEGNDPQVKAVR